MINFSKVDTKENLVTAINAIPADASLPADLQANAKAGAILAIGEVTTNGAHVNLRVNKINQWIQNECQVAGQAIKVSTPTPAE